MKRGCYVAGQSQYGCLAVQVFLILQSKWRLLVVQGAPPGPELTLNDGKISYAVPRQWGKPR